MRSTAAQDCPAFEAPAHSAPPAARSRLASSSTIIASLPPSSSETGTGPAAAARITSRPASVEPVKHSLSTPAPIIGLPATAPGMATRWNRPPGRPEDLTTSATDSPTACVMVAGFRMTALPATRAVMTSWSGMPKG